ncbi:N-terminal phage integrase SAM-like domain-containing protein [Virgibacillus proomii]|uniref:N-terminal phage integrase SAM-like domain-containing protein n=1 Tax=Virgibacillus proomii TaxID=84407 RepID=UPI001FE4C0FC|nr:N-terminal phage integrase SAM-like domain-containing protein [Virgibacillus proomii]
MKWYKKRRKESSYNKMKSIADNQLIPKFGKKRRCYKVSGRIIGQVLPGSFKEDSFSYVSIFNYSIRMEYAKDNPARVAGNIDIEEDKHVNY